MSDTAEYSAVATNQHGTATSKAKIIVKSKSPSFLKTLLTSHVFLCKHKRLFFTGPAGAGESCHLGLGESMKGVSKTGESRPDTSSWNHDTSNSSAMRGLIRSGN